ncbi:choline/ethanolamine kinase [Rhizoclosmatium globosum]|uniref:ethanolamine kinase n=1 Tax=Rhizoclosmatium globosum TaxID=329046 RepID=A0A1Y2C6Y5_9FUNG|nr:choline/ethanolamine kinase [Rhizoclosmatium globosum]|eukprot:ORY42783.1 choline/ethanolamine kinase [Rhizoclosmatium globosum]
MCETDRFKIRQIGQHHSFFFPQSPSSMSPALMTATENLKTLDFTMDHAHLLEGSAVAIQWAFPHWDMSEAKLVQQTHGITNKLVKCTYKGETVLIRTYGKGTDAIIDRNQEMNNMMVLSRNGLSPKVHGRFTNGLIYGYVDGIPFSVEDMSHPHKSTLVARHLANWHKVDASDIMSTKPKLFNTLHQWVDAIPKQFSNPAVDASFRSFITVDRLKKELTGLQVELEKVNAPIVFSHCDLLTGNIIFNAEKDRVDFIDYEYGSYNPRGFDIGNHFCEHAGFDCEWDLYPNQEFQRKWLREYLGSAHPDQEVTEDEITKLYAEVNKYALAAHLYWGIWALVQAEISDLDFDYAGYAKLRIDEYFRRKTGFLAL